MKKAFLVICALFLGAVGLAQAESDFRIPQDREGKTPWNLKQTGVRVATVRYSLTAQLVPGATVLVHGVLTSTKVTNSEQEGAYVELRATDTANTSTELLTPPLHFATTTRNTLYVFDPPLVAPGGLSLNVTTAAAVAAVFYTIASTNTQEDFFIPYDVTGNPGSPEFYGVKVASTAASGGVANDRSGADNLDYNTGEMTVETRPCLFDGYATSTGGATAAFMVFSDSASALGSNVMVLPPLLYNTFGGQENFLNPLNSKVVTFPWPLAMQNGLTVTNSVGTNRVRIFTRPRRALR